MGLQFCGILGVGTSSIFVRYLVLSTGTIHAGLDDLTTEDGAYMLALMMALLAKASYFSFGVLWAELVD